MAKDAIQLEIIEGIAHVVLDQPELGNPFNDRFCSDMCRIANALSASREARAVLLRANGRFFSVGGDIGMFVQHLDELPVQIRNWTASLHMGLARLARLDLPIVTAVHATAMGGAVALIAGSELVYAARSARFGSAYAGIGYSMDAGASFALASRMGLARARRFVLCAEVLDSETACRTGLVDFVVDDGAVLAEAQAAAERLARGPTRAYGEIRRIFQTALGKPFEAQLEDEAQGLARVAGSEDAREGIRAFAEKRKPVFKGR